MVVNLGSDRRIKIIIDSNVFISLEQLGNGEDAHSAKAAIFLRLANRLGCSIVLAHGTRADLLSAPPEVKRRRDRQILKYTVLNPIPRRPQLATEAGFPSFRTSNDEADLDILTALESGAGNWLVTQDGPLRKRALRAGFRDRVLSLEEAIETLESLLWKPSGLAQVDTFRGYEVDLSASIFDSLRADYDGFDSWWKTRVAGDRDVLVLGSPDNPEGIAVLKIKEDDSLGVFCRTLKICTFKIANEFSGSRRGELLLFASIDYARRNRCKAAYLRVLPDKGHFLTWLSDFGFYIHPAAKTHRGEHLVLKELSPDERAEDIGALAFNFKYGPGAMKLEAPHIIPIQAQWHRRLFPEAESQRTLFPREESCGNAIRKAYICRSPIRNLRGGYSLLFLRTAGEGSSAVTAIGVVESILVSTSAEQIASFVGNRTVYALHEIASECELGEVLAIKFRLDRTLTRPWQREEIEKIGAVAGSVQSIQRVRPEGIAWIRQQLGA